MPPSPRPATMCARTIRRATIGCLVGGTALILSACVSQHTYSQVKQQANAQADELTEAQTAIQELERERDRLHATNRREELALAKLKQEIKEVQVSYEDIHKANQAKLETLRLNIANLRARYQTMLREINQTKQLERRLEAVTARYEQEMAKQPAAQAVIPTSGTEGHQDLDLVAVITPQPSQIQLSTSAAGSTSQAGEAAEAPGNSSPGPALAPQLQPPTASATSPATAAAKPPLAAAGPKPVSPAAAHAPAQEESWFSNFTGWLTSLLDWLWV
ncbi:MAG: hypothetical protein HRU82_05960 [Nitrospira sp.]|nr:MAG: hypothetical protein HRU82_05960 [Nitrospira sp.]